MWWGWGWYDGGGRSGSGFGGLVGRPIVVVGVVRR